MKRLVLAAMLLLPSAVNAQQAPLVAVVPESITVGDVFHAAIRFDLPAGASIAAQDSLDLPADVEHAGRYTVLIDTAGGVRRGTVLYPLAAWRPGNYNLPAVRVRISDESGARDVDVKLPSFSVRSVLPPDTAGIKPKDAKDVLGANRLWWPLLLLALLLLAALIALYMWWKRRNAKEDAAPVVVLPRIPPRQAALAQLEALRREGLLERGELKLYYARLTEILRRYTATLDGSWGVDLTTSELAARIRRASTGTDGLDLVRILGTADLVKFARATLPRAAAAADIDASQSWIERFAVHAPESTGTQRAA